MSYCYYYIKDLGWCTTPEGERVTAHWITYREESQIIPAGCRVYVPFDIKVETALGSWMDENEDKYAVAPPVHHKKGVYFMSFRIEDAVRVAWDLGYRVERGAIVDYGGPGCRPGYWGSVWDALADRDDPLLLHAQYDLAAGALRRAEEALQVVGVTPAEAKAAVIAAYKGIS